ncbi:hypothetical protein ABW17_08245 [Mycobacterium nebraskense]|nr:hypothetical protein ABW17_08245 [Mycobacterium nebraskense]
MIPRSPCLSAPFTVIASAQLLIKTFGIVAGHGRRLRRWAPRRPQQLMLPVTGCLPVTLYVFDFRVFSAARTHVGEMRCDPTPHRRFGRIDPVVVAQPLRDRGHRDIGIQPARDPVAVRRDQRPRRRPRRRIPQLRKPPRDQLRPSLGAQRLAVGLDAPGDRRGQIFADLMPVAIVMPRSRFRCMPLWFRARELKHNVTCWCSGGSYLQVGVSRSRCRGAVPDWSAGGPGSRCRARWQCSLLGCGSS